MDDKWSEGFPDDVLYLILNQCSLLDCIRFGLVSKSWHRVSKLNISKRPPQLPWLMPCNTISRAAEEAGEEKRCVYSLSDKTIYNINISQIRGKHCCGSFIDSGGWLMSIDYNNMEVRLFHPWRGIGLKLPRLSFASDLSPEPNKIIRGKAAISDDAAVVAVINSFGNLAFCRTEDTSWTSLSATRYHDIIYHKGQFYAVRSDGTIGVLHINTRNPYVETLPGRVNFIPRRRYSAMRGKTYLVADSASGGIFIIRRFAQVDFVLSPGRRNNWNNCSTYDFRVYELGIEETTGAFKTTFVEVENLDDRVMFLGLNSSMIVMASQFPGFKENRNSIYFTHDWGLRSESADMGIFNMEARTIRPLSPNRAQPRSIWIRPPPLVK